MAYIPADATWYIAEIVIEIRVGRESRNVIHRNLTLIRAHSPNEAYSCAKKIGEEHEREYENPQGRPVRFIFRGISRLNVIHEPLDHGSEILYEEDVSVPEAKIQKMIPSKDSLSVFRPIERSTGPDYASRQILEEARSIVKSNKKERGD